MSSFHNQKKSADGMEIETITKILSEDINIFQLN